ncbi:efflux transporter periplasmic adaptor subunit [Jannaschia sp. LMIT008]|uniref:efflux RND transporter periplasmic adaptor subunit n=1 Tax=Jannaschia maritima TaxID=3032585 RepID=UPI0028117EAC|nr:efflux transporter periplasmic adaptor subunit [Jannaschia sp. LMIT008]
MRFLSRSLTALFLAALTVTLLAWAVQVTLSALAERGGDGGPGRPVEERSFRAAVVDLTPQDVTPVLSAFGEVRAARTLELRAPAGGRVVELSDAWADGGRVAAGDVLLRLDPADAEAAAALARADLSGAQADLRVARTAADLARQELDGAEAQRDLQAQALDRARDLSQRGIGAAATVEAAELALQAARQTVLTRRGALATAEARIDAAILAVERARIALDQAERDLADRTLTAAFDGILSDVGVRVGGLVAVNEGLGTLLDPSALEVAFRLSTTQFVRLGGPDGDVTGAPVRAVLDALGLDLDTTGRIVREAAVVAEGRTGREVFARLDPAPGFRPGDFVRVEIREPVLSDVFVVPATAVATDGTLLLVGDGNRLKRAGATVLRRQGDDVIVAGDGLAGRQAVALRGPALGPGILVDPIAPGAGTDPPPLPDLVELDPERRARLIAFVEGGRMPAEVKERLVASLQQDRVPADVVARIEGRMGG